METSADVVLSDAVAGRAPLPGTIESRAVHVRYAPGMELRILAPSALPATPNLHVLDAKTGAAVDGIERIDLTLSPQSWIRARVLYRETRIGEAKEDPEAKVRELDLPALSEPTE